VGLRQLGESARYVLTLADRVVEVLVEPEMQAFNVRIAGRDYEVAAAGPAAPASVWRADWPARSPRPMPS